MPRGLAGRIWLGVAAVALVALVVTGAGLFVALRDAHRDATTASLAALVAPLQLQIRRDASGGLTAADVEDLQTAVGPDVAVHVFLPARTFGPEDGRPPDDVLDAIGRDDGVVSGEFTADDGTRFVYAGLFFGGVTGQRRLVLTERDVSGAAAIGEVLRTLPAVIGVTLLVGGLVAWLLARSVRDPLRRLSRATVDVPAARATPVTPSGPTEVQDLARRFNAMVDELEATRRHEDELLANLRHDLRTPVTVIGGYATALLDGTATGAAATRAVEAIADEADRLTDLVDELGAVERYADGAAALRPEVLDAGAIVVAARERFLARAAAAGVDLLVVEGQEPADRTFAGDRVAIDRLIGNLVANAIGACQPGGHVWLEARASGDPSGRPHDRLPRHRRRTGVPAGHARARLRPLLPGRSVALGAGLRARPGHRARPRAGAWRHGPRRERRAAWCPRERRPAGRPAHDERVAGRLRAVREALR